VSAHAERPASAPQTASISAALTVRRGRPADVDRIAPLFDAYRQFYGAASDVGAACRYLTERLDREESVVLVATVRHPNRSSPPDADGDEIIGFVQLYRCFSSLSLGENEILNDLFIVPAWRNRGVAGRLLNASVAYARMAGAVRLELATQHTNTAALRLYQSRGFVPDTDFTHLSLSLDTSATL
jgi:ribosomal protein S18 acetylase RimI-like enzyme